MPHECSHSSPRWYALYVRVRHERVVGVQLAGRGLEAFLPFYLSRRKWADRYVSLEMPLFPGYVFCRFSSEQRTSVLDTSGVVRIVGFGRQAIPVDDEEINAIQRAIAAGLDCEPVPYAEVGRAVRIQSGPLAGVDGVLRNIKDTHRLVLSITLLNRSVSVEVDAADVGPVGASVPEPLKPPVHIAHWNASDSAGRHIVPGK